MPKKKLMFGDIGVRPLDISGPTTNHEIRLGRRFYRFNSDAWRIGEFSNVYRGVDKDDKEVLIKIAKSPDMNGPMQRELRVIDFYRDTAKLKPIGRYLPRIKDSFTVDGRLVVVQRYRPDLLSVERILSAHEDGLDPQDAAWVARRVMATAVAAEMGGIVHCAIVPDHVLVDRETHTPLHIGWAHAIDPRTETLTRVINRWRPFYPPEVFEKRRLDCRTDIYMAGQTIAYALGGDTSTGLPSSVPERLAEVVQKCTEENPNARYQNGKEALDGLTTVVRSLWGREYRNLEV